MMKTEISTNGEAPVELKEHRRGSAIPDHDEKSSEHRREDGSSGEEKKRSLFRRPGVIVAAAALAIAGIGYGAFAMFPSFNHESTDDAFIDVHFVSVAPKIAGRVAVVHADDNQLVKKGDVLVEIDPRDFQVALAQAKANLAKDKAAEIQANANEKRAQDLFTKKVISLWTETPALPLHNQAKQLSKPMKQQSSKLNSTWVTRKSQRRSTAT